MLARLTGVSPDTLRSYERRGVMLPPPRTANEYRRYPPSAVARVRLIQRTLAVGFTLHELARVLGDREAGGARASACARCWLHAWSTSSSS